MKALFVAPCLLIAALAFAAPNPAYVPVSSDSVVVIDHLDQLSPQMNLLLDTLEEPLTGDPLLLTTAQLLGLRFEKGKPLMEAKSLTVASRSGSMEDMDCFIVVEAPAVDVKTFAKNLETNLKEHPQENVESTVLQQGEWFVLKGMKTPAGAEKFLGFRAIPGAILFATSTDEAFAKRVGEGNVPSIKGTKSPLLEAFKPIKGAIGPTLSAKGTGLMGSHVADFGLFPELFAKIRDASFVAYATRSDLNFVATANMADETSAQQAAETLTFFKIITVQAVRNAQKNAVPDAVLPTIFSSIRAFAEGDKTKVTLRLPNATLEKALKEISAQKK